MTLEQILGELEALKDFVNDAKKQSLETLKGAVRALTVEAVKEPLKEPLPEETPTVPDEPDVEAVSTSAVDVTETVSEKVSDQDPGIAEAKVFEPLNVSRVKRPYRRKKK